MVDVEMQNLAEDMDAIVVYVGEGPDWEIDIYRDEHGKIHVVATDLIEGSQTSMVLGERGETQKV